MNWRECGVTDELELGTDVKTGQPYRCRLTCQKPIGHEGRHGNGPETMWSTEWFSPMPSNTLNNGDPAPSLAGDPE